MSDTAGVDAARNAEPAVSPGSAGATKLADAPEAPAPEKGGRVHIVRESRCRLCRERVARVDYKDIQTLLSFCRSRGRIMARKRSGNCAKHQRLVQRAIKQARFMGLMSYTDGEHRGAGRYGAAW